MDGSAPKGSDAMWPRVSVGLPVYNGERWLAESIESILRQTFGDLELIICDNASTDGTEAICRRYADRDSRIRYFRNRENVGGMRNANKAFRLARGEYYRETAHDDRCEPSLLKRLVEVLDTRPEVVVALSPSIAIDHQGQRLPHFYVGKGEGKFWSRGRSAPALLTDDEGVRHPTDGTAASPSRRFRDLMLTRGPSEATYGLIRSEVLRHTCLHGTYTGSDRVMLCDLALRGPFYVIEQPLYYKRWHESNRYKERGPVRMVWSRPELAHTGQPTFPHWLELQGYVTTLLHAPQLSLSERARCTGAIVRWMKSECRALASDAAFGAAMALGSRDWRRRFYADGSWASLEEPATSDAA